MLCCTAAQEKDATMAEFEQEFHGRLPYFAQHCHYAKWQAEQFKADLANLGPGEMIIDMDFSMNMIIREKREIQSQHWTPKCTISLFDAGKQH